MDTAILRRAVSRHGFPPSRRPRYRITEAALIKLSQRGVLSPPVGGHTRTGRRGAEWSPVHVREAVWYVKLRKRGLHGRRRAVAYWWRTGRDTAEAKKFFYQVLPVFGPAHASLAKAAAAFRRLSSEDGRERPVSWHDVVTSWGRFRDGLTELLMGLPPSQRHGAAEQAVERIEAVERIGEAARRALIHGPTHDDFQGILPLYLRPSENAVSLLARYLDPAVMKDSLDHASPALLDRVRKDLRALCAALLRKRRARREWRRLRPVVASVEVPWGARARKRLRADLVGTPEGAIALGVILSLVCVRFVGDQCGAAAIPATLAQVGRIAATVGDALPTLHSQ